MLWKQHQRLIGPWEFGRPRACPPVNRLINQKVSALGQRQVGLSVGLLLCSPWELKSSWETQNEFVLNSYWGKTLAERSKLGKHAVIRNVSLDRASFTYCSTTTLWHMHSTPLVPSPLNTLSLTFLRLCVIGRVTKLRVSATPPATWMDTQWVLTLVQLILAWMAALNHKWERPYLCPSLSRCRGLSPLWLIRHSSCWCVSAVWTGGSSS